MKEENVGKTEKSVFGIGLIGIGGLIILLIGINMGSTASYTSAALGAYTGALGRYEVNTGASSYGLIGIVGYLSIIFAGITFSNTVVKAPVAVFLAVTLRFPTTVPLSE